LFRRSDRPPSPKMPDSAEDCPFCAIVKAYPHPYTPSSTPEADTDPPAHIILSTPDVIAFLDALPLTKCHTLLIPRQHHEFISSTPADIAAELGRALPLVCRAAVNVAAADAFNVVQNNGKNPPPHHIPLTLIWPDFRNKRGTSRSTRAFSYYSAV
jgi:diadenosine tetraphosphate (Ap4A) HIT family hydrolase